MSKKTKFDKNEADAFFLRYKKGQDLDPLNLLVEWLTPFEKQILKMIEIGCGNGESLSFLSKSLNSSAFGLEPSKKAVNHIKKKFSLINVKEGFSDNIQFKDNFFDYVHLGFFLYLVDRKQYLKTISEADRILKFGGYLSIIDFDSPFPYSNKYKHKDGVFSHKIDNSKTFTSTGFYTLINKHTSSLKKKEFNSDIDQRVSIQLLYKEPKIFKI